MKTQHTPKFILHITLILVLLSLMLVLSQHAVMPAAAAGGHETEVTLTGGVLTITDVNGGSSNDNLTLSYAGGTYTLTDSGGLAIEASSIAGSTGSGTNTVTFPDTGITGITFDTLGGDDTISVNSVQASFADNFTITGGTGLDNATINADIATMGSGAVIVTTTGKILLNSGSSLTTVDGGITLDANSAGAQIADFVGLEANNATLQTTGTGDIQLLGKGSEIGGNDLIMYGVYFRNGTSVSSTATGATAGQIIINGTGGGGISNGQGVYLRDNTTEITSVDGDIEIIGQGGNTTFGANDGVYIYNIERIESTGVGTVAATITISGTSGTNEFSSGITITDAATDITTVDGNIEILGTSNGTGNNNYGVAIAGIEKIESTGTGTEAGTIKIHGIAGSGDSNNAGIHMFGTSTDIISVDGDIELIGVGGNGTGGANTGLNVQSFRNIASTGTGPLAATITISGTSGTGLNNYSGIYMTSSSTNITSVDGDIRLEGTSNGTSDGVGLWGIGGIESTGTGADAASITVIGNGNGNNNMHGIVFYNFDVTSAAGAIQLSGTVNPAGSSPYGLYGIVISSCMIQVTDGSLKLDGVSNGGDSPGIAYDNTNFVSIGAGNIIMNAKGSNLNHFTGYSTSSIGGTSHTGNILINTDSIYIDGTTIGSDGALTIQPQTPGTTISLGSFPFGPGTLDLNDTELANLQDGFSSITIGNSDTGDITVESAIFNDLLFLQTAGYIHNTFGTSITNIGNTSTFNGTLAPGSSPGTFSVNGDASFADDSAFAVELTGTTTTGPHDKLTAIGGVTIGSNVSLNLDTSGYTSHQSGAITIIENGNGAVSGTFNGLPEGAETNNGGTPNFIISYLGGDGNDVTLTATTPTALTLANFGTTASGATTNGLFVVIAGCLGLFSLLFVWRRRQESANGA